MESMMQTIGRWLAALAVVTLAACGGGGDDAGAPVFGDGNGNGAGGGGGTTAAVTLDVRILDAAGNATTTVQAGRPVRAEAVLKRDGVAVADEIVQFTLDQPADLVNIDPAAGSVLTDAQGVAAVTVSSLGTATGAGRLRASATVGDQTATAAANFFTSGSATLPPSTLALSALEIGSNAVSAYGTTGLRVRVLQGGAPYTGGPVTVNFTTSCPAGKATITGQATTQSDGFAEATFVDNGCAPASDTTVTVTASISTDTKSGSLLVRSPTTGSLRFIAVDPTDKSITLRGQGGGGRQENATVTFRLVDVAGQGVGDVDVCFESATYVGGLNIDGFGPSKLPDSQGSAELCGSDNLSVVRYVKRTNPDGTVSVQINSGTVPTPVRVRARTLYPANSTALLESYSDTLSISTGLPLQRSFSLSVDRANIDGGSFDGEIATITVRLADQFSNPVPDGTVVNFIGSGAAVCTANNGSCRTENGACSCQVVSQERRPPDNRVVVTAYAVGLEDFDDRDGDNAYTAVNSPATGKPQQCTDAALVAGKDCFYDLGDAYVDANKDGRSSSQTINGDTDILVPYQKPNAFTAAGDGVRGTAHIRASTVIYLSQSSSAGDPTVVLPLAQLSKEWSLTSGRPTDDQPFVRLQPKCPQGTPVPQATVAVLLDDGIGNPMAAGTALAAVDPTDNISVGIFRPSTVLAAGARPPSPSVDLPNLPKLLAWTSNDANGNVPTMHSIVVRGVQDKCSGQGAFSLQVTSPRGGAATARVLYEEEFRTTARFSFDVRYVDRLTFDLQPQRDKRVAMVRPTLIERAVDPDLITQYGIDWGDTSEPVTWKAGSIIADPDLSHTYKGAGNFTVTLAVMTASGATYSATRAVTVP